jgi:hypothetical protein
MTSRRKRRIFLSHSNKDNRFIRRLESRIRQAGFQPVVAERHSRAGSWVSDSVFPLIDGCQCLVVILTKPAVGSPYVQQEVGYALKCRLPIVPVKRPDVTDRSLGFLKGRIFVPYPAFNVEQTIREILRNIRRLVKRRKAL